MALEGGAILHQRRNSVLVVFSFGGARLCFIVLCRNLVSRLHPAWSCSETVRRLSFPTRTLVKKLLKSGWVLKGTSKYLFNTVNLGFQPRMVWSSCKHG